MKNILLLILVLSSMCVQSTSAETRFVFDVIDGDTIDLEDGERIRLIGIDAPDVGASCYTEATEKLKDLILNKNIKMETDVRDLDVYERSLRYIYLGNLFVNLEMIRSGYAYTFEVEPNIKYADQLLNAEIFAEENKIGCLWN